MYLYKYGVITPYVYTCVCGTRYLVWGLLHTYEYFLHNMSCTGLIEGNKYLVGGTKYEVPVLSQTNSYNTAFCDCIAH